MRSSSVRPRTAPEIAYMQERRRQLGGYVPSRSVPPSQITAPPLEYLKESLDGSGGREVSSTMAFVRILTLLMKHSEIGKRIVPIIPDEARTFGMESLFRQFGIYASQGQLYKPHDADIFLYYKESKDGQILEEGITEAGSMCSFTAAGTAYANYRVEMIPFFIYYSMFGFQRIGDLIWAFGDARGKGFLCGGTAGRTTLSGEGLQHQDGHSLVLSSTVPTCASYDPAYAYEIAVIVQDGIRRMYQEGEDRFYYITLYNENYAMPRHAGGVQAGRRAEGHLQVPRSGEGQAEDAALRQRADSERGLARAADAGRKIQRRRATFGASPATTSCAATRWKPNAGTGCIPIRPAAHALHRGGAQGRRRTDRCRDRLHEGGARPVRALASRAGWKRWAPMGSAAATIASICASISRSTRRISPRPRFRVWRATANST